MEAATIALTLHRWRSVWVNITLVTSVWMGIYMHSCRHLPVLLTSVWMGTYTHTRYVSMEGYLHAYLLSQYGGVLTCILADIYSFSLRQYEWILTRILVTSVWRGTYTHTCGHLLAAIASHFSLLNNCSIPWNRKQRERDSNWLKPMFSDSKSCLSGLNWPRSGKKSEFLALFGLVEGTLGIGWKWLVFGLWWFH